MSIKWITVVGPLVRVAAVAALVLLVSNTTAMAIAAFVATGLLLAVRPPAFWVVWGPIAAGAVSVRWLLLRESYDAAGAALLWLAASAVLSLIFAWRGSSEGSSPA